MKENNAVKEISVLFFKEQSVCTRKCIQVATTNSIRKKSFRRASEVMLCSKSKNCRLLRQFCRLRCRCIMKMFVGKENSVIESRLCAPGLILSLVCAFRGAASKKGVKESLSTFSEFWWWTIYKALQ